MSTTVETSPVPEQSHQIVGGRTALRRGAAHSRDQVLPKAVGAVALHDSQRAAVFDELHIVTGQQPVLAAKLRGDCDLSLAAQSHSVPKLSISAMTRI